MEEFHEGTARWIIEAPGAAESFRRVNAELQDGGGELQGDSACMSQLMHYIKRFADGRPPAAEGAFRDEGDGIFTLRARGGVCIHGWYALYLDQPAFVISHWRLESWGEFNNADRRRVLAAREAYGQR